MAIYTAKYLVGIDSAGEPVFKYEDLVDEVLLDCVAESEFEVWQYFVSKALAVKAELRKTYPLCEFLGLECIAS